MNKMVLFALVALTISGIIWTSADVFARGGGFGGFGGGHSSGGFGGHSLGGFGGHSGSISRPSVGKTGTKTGTKPGTKPTTSVAGGSGTKTGTKPGTKPTTSVAGGSGTKTGPYVHHHRPHVTYGDGSDGNDGDGHCCILWAESGECLKWANCDDVDSSQ